MDNNELLAQVLAALNERTEALEKKLDERTEALEKKLDERTEALEKKLEERTDLLMRMIHEQSVVLTEKMHEVSRESETRINLTIEHDVCKKIESLFDGYQLVHEKQWELDRENQLLRDRLDAIELRLAALESKSA